MTSVPHPRTDELRQFTLEAKGELLILAPAHTKAPDRQLCRVVAARGARVRVIQEVARSASSCVTGGLALCPEVEVRCLPLVPHALVLVDRRIARLTAGGAGGITVTVEQPALVEALLLLFTTLWRRAQPQGSAPSRRRRDAAVLNLLARGATDDSASAQLGVSIRTYRRWVADLMTRLGATSRFQAGLLASRDGWCSEPVAAPGDRLGHRSPRRQVSEPA